LFDVAIYSSGISNITAEVVVSPPTNSKYHFSKFKMNKGNLHNCISIIGQQIESVEF